MAISEPTTEDLYLPATLAHAANALAILAALMRGRAYDPRDSADLATLARIGAEVVEVIDPVFQALAVIGGFSDAEIGAATVRRGLDLIEQLETQAGLMRQQAAALRRARDDANDNGG